MCSRKFLRWFCILQILSLRNLKTSSESKSTETSNPLRLKELNAPKSRPRLKVEKKYRIPSLVFSLLQRTRSNSLKYAIFDAISSGFVNKLLFDV